MKNTIRTLVTIIAVCLALVSAGVASAQAQRQEQKPGLFLQSATDTTNIRDDVLAGIYHEADASLMDQVKEGLTSRDIIVAVRKPGQEIAADPGQFILVVKIEEIELGRKRLFGRTARVRVSYTFQNKDRFDMIRRTDEETSVQQWQNCIRKISEQVAMDTSDDLAKYTAPRAEDKGGKSK
jgi:hypothetical protein